MGWEKEGAKAWALPGYGLDRSAPTTPDEPSTLHGDVTLPAKPKFAPKSFPPRFKVIEGRSRSSNTFTPSVRGPAVRRERVPYSPSPKGSSQISIGKKRWMAGIGYDVVRLPAGLIKRAYNAYSSPAALNPTKSLSHTMGRERITELVSERTGVFIKQSDHNDRYLLIWGEPEPVAQAKEILFQLIDDFYGPKSINGPGQWAKVHPQYEADVEKAVVEKAAKKAEYALREEPTNREAFPKEMIFFWPREGPFPRQCLGDQLEKLDSIRKEFKVHVFSKGDSEDFIHIHGSEDVDLAQIADQLREQWKAAVAKFDVQVKVYLVEPQTVGTMQGKVTLVKTNGFSLPVLNEVPAITDHAHPKAIDLDSIRAENDYELLHCFRKALSKAHFFAGLLRMRIHFGTLVVGTYRKAAGNDGYSLEEFRDMMLHEKASARLVPGLKLAGQDLLVRCMRAGALLAPLDSAYSLSDIETMTPTYGASFEFSGTADSQFRLEVDFRQRALEIEQGRHRWFKTHKGNNGQARRLPLQVGVVDFSRSDWQADIEIFEPVPSSEVRPNLAQFQRTVRFDERIRTHSMTAVPRKRIIFEPEGAVASFTEKASIQLRIKKTNYVLELTRFDRYTKSRTGWSQPPHVSWGATLFDPKWDAMLGSGLDGDGSKKAGKFTARFETLFPSYSRLGDDSDDQGFWELFQFVDKISELLGASEMGSQELSTETKSRVATDLLSAELGMLF